MSLTQKAKDIYQLQIDKGWCKKGEERDVNTLKALVLSECSEALEAFRKGKYADIRFIGLQMLLEEFSAGYTNMKLEAARIFKEQVKDTFEDEIADMAIRLLDLAGYLGLDLGDKLRLTHVNPKEDFIQEYIRCIHITSTFIGCDKMYELHHIYSYLNWCYSISKTFEFDLMLHIELKLAYNKTREPRHGNKVV